MTMYARDIRTLRRIIGLAQKLIDESPKARRGRPSVGDRKDAINNAIGSRQTRRSGQELVEFRKMLKSERKKGVSVAELARKHGVSPAYIYMLR